MPLVSPRARLVRNHLACLQAKLLSQAEAEKAHMQLELDPGELDFFRKFECEEKKAPASPSSRSESPLAEPDPSIPKPL